MDARQDSPSLDFAKDTTGEIKRRPEKAPAAHTMWKGHQKNRGTPATQKLPDGQQTRKKKGKNMLPEESTDSIHRKNHSISLTVRKRENHGTLPLPTAGTLLGLLRSTVPQGKATSEPRVGSCRAFAWGRIVEGQGHGQPRGEAILLLTQAGGRKGASAMSTPESAGGQVGEVTGTGGTKPQAQDTAKLTQKEGSTLLQWRSFRKPVLKLLHPSSLEKPSQTASQLDTLTRGRDAGLQAGRTQYLEVSMDDGWLLSVHVLYRSACLVEDLQNSIARERPSRFHFL